MPQVIVSVKDSAEAHAALDVGVTWLDVKNPNAGSLGMAITNELSAISNLFSGKDLKLSAALGELAELVEIPKGWPWNRIEFVKVGMSKQADSHWGMKLDNLAREVRNLGSRLVIGAYADHRAAYSPPWKDCLEFAISRKMPAILVDTFCKNGLRLLDCLGIEEVKQAIEMARENSMQVALAGSLNLSSVKQLMRLEPSFFAARGAFCREGDRSGGFDSTIIKDWLSVVQNFSN